MIPKIEIAYEGTTEMWNECEKILKDLQEHSKIYLEHEDVMVRRAARSVYKGFHMADPPNTFLPSADVYIHLTRLYRSILRIQYPPKN
jgi:hypothetical protein